MAVKTNCPMCTRYNHGSNTCAYGRTPFLAGTCGGFDAVDVATVGPESFPPSGDETILPPETEAAIIAKVEAAEAGGQSLPVVAVSRSCYRCVNNQDRPPLPCSPSEKAKAIHERFVCWRPVPATEEGHVHILAALSRIEAAIAKLSPGETQPPAKSETARFDPDPGPAKTCGSCRWYEAGATFQDEDHCRRQPPPEELPDGMRFGGDGVCDWWEVEP